MTDWSALRHAYGDASDLSTLFSAISPDPNSEVWYELWSRLCHQGTVYSASFAALPVLLALAEQWKPSERAQPIALASSILTSRDVHDCETDPRRPAEGVIPRFRQLCRESLATPGVSRVEFIYLLQAARSFDGDQFWGHQLDHLADGEFPGTCPSCGADLYLVIGDDGFFTSAGEWIRPPEAPRTSIDPNRGPLPDVGRLLLESALAADQDELAEQIRHVFGTSVCPSCGSQFAVPVAIGAF